MVAFENSSHVVGASGTMIGLEGKAYLWKNGERIELNNAIFPESGWDLREARDINDRGQICGSGLINGEIHAYLLTPIVSVVADIQGNGSNTEIRLTSEIVMKAASMEIPVLLSRSGITLMALEIAGDLNITMIARAKGNRFLLYNGAENIIFDRKPLTS